MGLFERRKRETPGQIAQRVMRKYGETPPTITWQVGAGRGDTAPPLQANVINPVFLRKVAREVKRVQDRGLLAPQCQARDPLTDQGCLEEAAGCAERPDRDGTLDYVRFCKEHHRTAQKELGAGPLIPLADCPGDPSAT